MVFHTVWQLWQAGLQQKRLGVEGRRPRSTPADYLWKVWWTNDLYRDGQLVALSFEQRTGEEVPLKAGLWL